MKKYLFLTAFFCALFVSEKLLAQTNSTAVSEVTVLKKANPNYQGTVITAKQFITDEKAQNPNNNTEEKKDKKEEKENVLITEEKSKNPN
jgi:hypothetical protein